MVIAVPALLVMVMLIVQFAVYEHARHIAQAVAAQALAATRIQGGTAATGQATGQDLLTQLGPTIVHPVVEVRRGADRVTVTVTGSAETVLPGLAFPITVRDDGPTERILPITNPAAGR